MNVTKMHVIATSSKNKRITCGDATFNDGATYGFITDHFSGNLVFFGYRKRQGVNERFSFASLKRQKAVEEYLS